MVEDITEDIVAKSDQLNAEDLIAGPIVVKLTGFKRLKGDQQPWTIPIDGGRQPWKPCKTMRRLIVKLWGNNPNVWMGRLVRLYNETSVRWAGNPVGGIRVSGMSDIGQDQTVVLTETRGKKRDWPIELLKTEAGRNWAAEFEAANVVDAAKMLRDAKTAAQRKEVLDSVVKHEDMTEAGYQLLVEYADSKGGVE